MVENCALVVRSIIMATFTICYILIALSCVVAQEPIVEIADGLLQGSTRYSTMDRPYSSFLAIPFGKPPIGPLRFTAPQPSSSWTGVLDATREAPMCAQNEGFGFATIGSEDCLYLNVYSPKLPDNTTNPNLPVIVWIYGGGFSRGGSQSYTYGPGKYMNKDVVLVAIGYRLGPFGFLSTADSAAPGNFGLYDQVLALKWVQKNIAAFGGNPYKVTIQGESAGAASVSYLILSPLASGLFHAAIGESGSALNPWALQKFPMNLTVTMATDLGCPTDDTTLLVECLRNKTVDELVHEAWILGASDIDYTILNEPFVPVVDGELVPDWPLNLLNAETYNKVPVLIGCNKDEGTWMYQLTKSYFTTIDEHFFDVVLPDILYTLFKYDHNLINVSYAIKSEYYDKIDVNDSVAVAGTSIDMLSDGRYLAPHDANARKLASSGLPVYNYIFAYTGTSTSNFSGEPEVSHADELPYLFEQPGVRFDDNDTAVSNLMVDMWTSFATTFNPTPIGYAVQWESSTAAQPQYLYIYQDSDLSMVFDYRSEQMYFWSYIVAGIFLA